jgi:hypothetical protein
VFVFLPKKMLVLNAGVYRQKKISGYYHQNLPAHPYSKE